MNKANEALLKEHNCAFNDGEQRCECFIDALEKKDAEKIKLPERILAMDITTGQDEGWNDCLDEIKQLNKLNQ